MSVRMSSDGMTMPLCPLQALLFDLESGRCHLLGRSQGEAHAATVSAVRFCSGGDRLLTSSCETEFASTV